MSNLVDDFLAKLAANAPKEKKNLKNRVTEQLKKFI